MPHGFGFKKPGIALPPRKKIEEHTEKHFFSLKTVQREAVPREAVELSENICQDPSATVTVAAEI